jgi:hypothetical protein
MQNKYVPDEFQPVPQEQGLLAPPGRKPPIAVGAGTLPPPGGHGPGGDGYAALRRRRARRLRALGILFAAIPTSLLVFILGANAAPLMVLAAGAALAAEGLHQARGFIARHSKRRLVLHPPR